jgi:hypothetical protein
MNFLWSSLSQVFCDANKKLTNTEIKARALCMNSVNEVSLLEDLLVIEKKMHVCILTYVYACTKKCLKKSS